MTVELLVAQHANSQERERRGEAEREAGEEKGEGTVSSCSSLPWLACLLSLLRHQPNLPITPDISKGSLHKRPATLVESRKRGWPISFFPFFHCLHPITTGRLIVCRGRLLQHCVSCLNLTGFELRSVWATRSISKNCGEGLFGRVDLQKMQVAESASLSYVRRPRFRPKIRA